jgi:hypothetical protein
MIGVPVRQSKQRRTDCDPTTLSPPRAKRIRRTIARPRQAIPTVPSSTEEGCIPSDLSRSLTIDRASRGHDIRELVQHLTL